MYYFSSQLDKREKERSPMVLIGRVWSARVQGNFYQFRPQARIRSFDSKKTYAGGYKTIIETLKDVLGQFCIVKGSGGRVPRDQEETHCNLNALRISIRKKQEAAVRRSLNCYSMVMQEALRVRTARPRFFFFDPQHCQMPIQCKLLFECLTIKTCASTSRK